MAERPAIALFRALLRAARRRVRPTGMRVCVFVCVCACVCVCMCCRCEHAGFLWLIVVRTAASLPTQNRRMMAEDKVRFEFRKHAKETDPEAVRELFLVGYTHLDTLETQGQHLTALAKMDMRAIKGVRNTLEE